MISFIKGKLADKSPESVVIDVNGLGYELFISGTSFAQLPSKGEEVCLQTYLHVREDTMQLYGFVSQAEKKMFEQLISVTKIGPKVALAILSAFTVLSLKKAILTQDGELISTVPGIGQKTAQRIILELREKLSLPDLEVLPASVGASTDSVCGQVRSALVGLGYTVVEARKALENLPAEGEVSAGEMLKQALRNLASS